MGVVLGIKEDGVRQPVLVDESGRVNVISTESAPLVVSNPDGSSVGGAGANGTAKTATKNAVAIAATSTSKILPVADGTYILQARGDDAFIATGSGSASAAISASGFSLVVCDGTTVGPIKLEGDYIAWIGTTTSGFLTILSVEE